MDERLESGRRMKTLIMLTVPRTGTGFFKKLLDQHFKPISMGDARCGVEGLVVSHVSMAGVEMVFFDHLMS